MNKSAIALAIAASVGFTAAAQADTTLYGSVRPSVDYLSIDANGNDDGTWDVVNNSSRLGVKGSEDLGNGLAAVYQYEFGVDVSDTGTLGGRLAYVGLKGNFGTVAIGRQESPLYTILDNTTDAFNGLITGPAYNAGAIGATGRVGNAVAYVTPDFNGLTGIGALVVDGSNGTEGEDVDWYQLGATYTNGGLFVGGAYASNQNNDDSIWGLTGAYDFNGLYLAGLYMSKDAGDDNGQDADSYDLLAAYTFGSNVVRASWGQVDPDGGEKADTWILGFEHNLSKRTRVWAEYGDTEDASLVGADEAGFNSASNLSIGIRHDF